MDILRKIEIVQHDKHVQSVAGLARQFGVRAFLVGGSLRDALLGRGVRDLDFILDGALQELPEALAQLGHGRFFWLDQQRRQSRVVSGHDTEGYTLDFAPLRGRTIDEDLALRDFTINALALPLGGDACGLLDPLGGLHDLAASRIRPCSPRSFADDPLRLLRAVRFAATLGFTIEPTTWEDLRAKCRLLEGVAGERIRDEFFQILSSADSGHYLRQLRNAGLLQQLVGDISLAPDLIDRIARVGAVECLFDAGADHFPEHWSKLKARLANAVEGGIPLAALVKLAAFLFGDGARDSITTITDRLRLGTKAQQQLVKLCRCGHDAAVLPNNAAGDRVLFRFFYDQQPAGPELVLLPFATGQLTGETAGRMVAYYYDRYQPADGDLLLNGAQIITLLDVAPGPELGDLLGQLRQAERAGLVATPAEAQELLLKNWLTKAKPTG